MFQLCVAVKVIEWWDVCNTYCSVSYFITTSPDLSFWPKWFTLYHKTVPFYCSFQKISWNIYTPLHQRVPVWVTWSWTYFPRLRAMDLTRWATVSGTWASTDSTMQTHASAHTSMSSQSGSFPPKNSQSNSSTSTYRRPHHILQSHQPD